MLLRAKPKYVLGFRKTQAMVRTIITSSCLILCISFVSSRVEAGDSSKKSDGGSTATKVLEQPLKPLPDGVSYDKFMGFLESELRARWHPPDSMGTDKTIVKFFVHNDGKISDCVVDKSSGDDKADESALKAIKELAKTQRPPGSSPDPLVVRFTFVVNPLDTDGGVSICNQDLTPYIRNAGNLVRSEFRAPANKRCRATAVFRIARTGMVTSAKIKSSSGDQDFDKEVLDTAGHVSFEKLPTGAPKEINIEFVFDTTNAPPVARDAQTPPVNINHNTSTSSADRENAVQLNNVGVQRLKSLDYAGAIQKFVECLKVYPEYRLAKENMAICYNNWGISLKETPAEAIGKFRKSLYFATDNPISWQNLDVTIKTLGKNPNSPEDRIHLGKQCLAAGDLEGATIEFASALKLKDDPALRLELGNLYYVGNRLDDAISQFNIAAASAGIDPILKARIYKQLGQVFQTKKDLPHAVEAYYNSLALNKSDRELLELYKSVWIAAVQKDATNPVNHVGLGQAYMFIGDFNQSTAELRTALTFDRNNAAAAKLLAILPLAQRKFERDKHIDNGVDLQTRKLYDAAIQEYTAALAQDLALPADQQATAGIMLNIGSANQSKHDYATAASFYQKALQKNPNLTAAKSALKICQEKVKISQDKTKSSEPETKEIKDKSSTQTDSASTATTQALNSESTQQDTRTQLPTSETNKKTVDGEPAAKDKNRD